MIIQKDWGQHIWIEQYTSVVFQIREILIWMDINIIGNVLEKKRKCTWLSNVVVKAWLVSYSKRTNLVLLTRKQNKDYIETLRSELLHLSVSVTSRMKIRNSNMMEHESNIANSFKKWFHKGTCFTPDSQIWIMENIWARFIHKIWGQNYMKHSFNLKKLMHI